MMQLTPKLLRLTLVGAEWVLWLLLALSVLSVVLLLERGLVLARMKSPTESTIAKLRAWIQQGQLDEALSFLENEAAGWAGVLAAGLRERSRGLTAVEAAMAAAKTKLRVRMEERLSWLGTLGSNAPFIGLFGTVLGIIKAFRDLSENQASNGGVQVIMAGISEALVATAVGLFVAIPAVVGFNLYNRLIRRRMSHIEAAAQEVLAALSGDVTQGKGAS